MDFDKYFLVGMPSGFIMKLLVSRWVGCLTRMLDILF